MDTITVLFRNAVERFSTRTALIEPTEGDQLSTLTYQAMQQRVHMFAGYLQQQQITKGERLSRTSPARTPLR
jgi:acyl-CoA synthetase (AMP-forming)/AMP-acid ligase II